MAIRAKPKSGLGLTSKLRRWREPLNGLQRVSLGLIAATLLLSCSNLRIILSLHGRQSIIIAGEEAQGDDIE